MSAEAEIKQFIDRVLRLKEEQDARRPYPIPTTYAVADRDHRGLIIIPRGTRIKDGLSVREAAPMLDLCSKLTWAGSASGDFPEDRRGFTLACRLTGLKWDEVQFACHQTRRFGPNKTSLYWAPFMSGPDERIVGFVYSATSQAMPGLTKIGFSRNPVKRMRSLSREIGAEVTLEACVQGTMLHEWALHQIIFRQPASEWHPTEDVPIWLFEPFDVMRRAA